MLSSITISNFRGFQRIALDQLAKVSILVGNNGKGKTTILEALSIAAEPDNGVPITQAGKRRDLPQPTETSDLCFRSIFRDLRAGSNPEFEFVVDGITKTLRISPSWEFLDFNEKTVRPPPQDTSLPILGLRMELTPGSGKPVINHIQLSANRDRPPGWLERPVRNNTTDRLRSYTIEARNATDAKGTAATLAGLIRTNKLGDLLRMVRLVEPKVQAFHSVVEGDYPLIWATVNDQNIPVNLLGDGFCRLLLIGTGMVSGAQLILVDEIDSGLHRDVMTQFWSALFTLISPHSGQIVCATHNEEMLRAAAEAFASTPEMLAVFRVSRDADGMGKAVRYGQPELADAFAFGFDPRG